MQLTVAPVYEKPSERARSPMTIDDLVNHYEYKFWSRYLSAAAVMFVALVGFDYVVFDTNAHLDEVRGELSAAVSIAKTQFSHAKAVAVQTQKGLGVAKAALATLPKAQALSEKGMRCAADENASVCQ